MRFSTILVGAFAAIVAAQSTTVAPPASSVSLDSATATYVACLKTCRDDDVNCRAKCGGVPFPSDSQANATNVCAAACPKGKGTEPEVLEWNKCVSSCVEKNFWASSGGTPSPTGAAGGSGSGSSGSGSSSTTGASGGSAAKTSGTASGSGTAQTNAPNPANALRVGTSAVGLVGFMAAFLVL
ncbi:hypothetical protein RB595_000819 [Gaeumannomyces hyphopodioides]